MCAPSESLRRLEPREAAAPAKDQGQGEGGYTRYKATRAEEPIFIVCTLLDCRLFCCCQDLVILWYSFFHAHMHAVPGCIISHWCIFQFAEGSRVEMTRLTLPISRRAAPWSTSCLHYRHYFPPFPTHNLELSSGFNITGRCDAACLWLFSAAFKRNTLRLSTGTHNLIHNALH